jgi:hypothetical protein
MAFRVGVTGDCWDECRAKCEKEFLRTGGKEVRKFLFLPK